ncbi:BnaAnng34740D [Brassica napus]|uniref:BnaAnng34740D protein n=1 Tax=Brassica napus TaxID=3708 RepID=A0A078JYI5_BRANA|nr:BnaAnng34740D [Brassica napus]
MLIAEAIEQKKVQEQPHVEQDTAFSTRPSPARPVSAKKPVGARASNGGANGTPNRRLSLNANQNGSRSLVKEGRRSIRYKGTSNSIHADEKKLIHFELDRQMEKNVASSMHT